MARRRNLRWAFSLGVVVVLWFALIAIAGATKSPSWRAAGGGALIGLYVVQVVLTFLAPVRRTSQSPPRSRQRRARWLWLSAIPLLGTWLPALAGLRARAWRWVALGIACEAIAIDAVIQMSHSAHQDPAEAAKLSSLLLVGWLGGVVSSMLIRPAYERRVLGTVVERNWPAPTAPARALTHRYALVTYIGALALIAAVVEAEKQSNDLTLLGAANIVGEALTVALMIPLIRSRRLRLRDLGLRRTLPVPGAGYAVLALVGYLLAISVWIVLIPQTTDQAAHKLTAVSQRPGTLAAILIVLALAVFAPVCEEIFFRGMLYRSLRNRLSLWPAVLIAGALFGLTIPVKIVFGVLMCLLYERSGSLLPCIAVHSFVDGSAADVAVTGTPYVAFAFYAVLLLAVLALRLIRRSGDSASAPGRSAEAAELTQQLRVLR